MHQLSLELTTVIADVAKQILRVLEQEQPLVYALYQWQEPANQAWMDALPEEARIGLHFAVGTVAERCRAMETDITRTATHLAHILSREVDSLRGYGFNLEGTQLVYNDEQRRAHRCYEAIDYVFASAYRLTPDELIARLVTVSQREEFQDVFLRVLQQFRPHLVRKYKVAWFKRLEGAVVTAEHQTVPRIASKEQSHA